jgi:hypothetical protein
MVVRGSGMLLRFGSRLFFIRFDKDALLEFHEWRYITVAKKIKEAA